MVGNIARIEQLQRKLAPLVFVDRQFHRVELVVEQAALAAHQVRVEVVRLETIDDRRTLADRTILEPQNGRRARFVFVGREDRVRGANVEGRRSSQPGNSNVLPRDTRRTGDCGRCTPLRPCPSVPGSSHTPVAAE